MFIFKQLQETYQKESLKIYGSTYQKIWLIVEDEMKTETVCFNCVVGIWMWKLLGIIITFVLDTASVLDTNGFFCSLDQMFLSMMDVLCSYISQVQWSFFEPNWMWEKCICYILETLSNILSCLQTHYCCFFYIYVSLLV